MPTSTAPRLTAHDVKLIQDSFARVAPHADDVAKTFYAKLFEIAPDARGLFRSNMAEQREKLIATLAYVVRGLSDLGSIRPAVRDLGKRHKGYRVTQAHYAPVGQALIATLAERLGAGFTAEHRRAWSAAYEILSREMIDAAQSPLGR